MSAINKSAGKVLRVLFALRGHYLTGISNKELSESLNETPVFITRALQTLEENGWAEKRDNGNYAPSMKPIHFGTACKEEYDRMQDRIDEYKQRLSPKF